MNSENYHSVSVNQSDFGKLPNGESAILYVLTKQGGITASITNFGGIVTSILVSDKQMNDRNVVLGFKTIEEYLDANIYAGSLVGRVAGRVKNARCSIDGEIFHLSQNEGNHHVHGGFCGLDKKLWHSQIHDDGLTLTCSLIDGEEWYPGNVDITVYYSLTENNGLKIDFQAVTDRPTPVTLTGHSYFNLGGEGSGTALDHRLKIDASHFIPFDANFHTFGQIRPVFGSNDFRVNAPLSDRIAGLSQQHGDFYKLKSTSLGEPKEVAALYCDHSGIMMRVFTDSPYLQLYTGVGLNAKDGEGRKKYSDFDGICLECQNFSEGFNYPHLGTNILRPGEIYHQTIEYRFDTAEEET